MRVALPEKSPWSLPQDSPLSELACVGSHTSPGHSDDEQAALIITQQALVGSPVLWNIPEIKRSELVNIDYGLNHTAARFDCKANFKAKKAINLKEYENIPLTLMQLSLIFAIAHFYS